VKFMVKPPECEKLKDVKKDLLCECKEIKYPSWIDRNKRESKGCLIAHTLLALVEIEKILHRVIGSVRRAFNVLENSATIEPTEVLYSTLLFHDIGKIDNHYRTGELTSHNVISAYLAKIVLEKIYPVSVTNSISMAIYLHHEAYHWRDLALLPILDILRLKKEISVEVNKKDLLELLTVFRENCTLFSKQGTLCKVINNIINIIGSIEEHLKFKAKISVFFPKELQRHIKPTRGVAKFSALRPVFVLYRLLHLVDCRAASVREGLDKYWACGIRDIKKKWLAYSMLPRDLSF